MRRGGVDFGGKDRPPKGRDLSALYILIYTDKPAKSAKYRAVVERYRAVVERFILFFESISIPISASFSMSCFKLNRLFLIVAGVVWFP